MNEYQISNKERFANEFRNLTNQLVSFKTRNPNLQNENLGLLFFIKKQYIYGVNKSKE